jgi:hypothetical protein
MCDESTHSMEDIRETDSEFLKFRIEIDILSKELT